MSQYSNRVLDFFILWEFFPRDKKVINSTISKLNRLHCTRHFTRTRRNEIIKRLNSDKNTIDGMLKKFDETYIMQEFDRKKLNVLRKLMYKMVCNIRDIRKYTFDTYVNCYDIENEFDKRNKQYQLFIKIRSEYMSLFEDWSFLQALYEMTKKQIELDHDLYGFDLLEDMKKDVEDKKKKEEKKEEEDKKEEDK